MESLGFLILKTGIRLSCPHRYIGANRNPPVLSSVHIMSHHSLPPSPKSPMPVGLRPADGRFKDVLRGLPQQGFDRAPSRRRRGIRQRSPSIFGSRSPPFQIIYD